MTSFYTNFIRAGNSILLRYIEDGERKVEKITDFQPSVYIPITRENDAALTAGFSIHGDPLKEIVCDSMNAASRIVSEAKDVGQRIFGYREWANQYIAWRWPITDLKKNWKSDQICVACLDIETENENGFPSITQANERINIIVLRDLLTSISHIFHLGTAKGFDNIRDVEGKKYYAFSDEAEMLQKFIKVFRRIAPDIVSGWNVELFDIAYVCNRIMNVLDEKWLNKLSVWGKVEPKKVRTKYGEEELWDIWGCSVLDLLTLWKKYVALEHPQERYTLDHISKVDLGDEKLKHSSGLPGHLLYRDHFGAAMDYCVKDVDLAHRIDLYRNLTATVMAIAYSTGVNFHDVLSQIRTWHNAIFIHLVNRGIQLPITNNKPPRDEVQGGYNKPPLIGKHEWVVSFDVTSEYPSLIMALNISPEVLIDNVEGPVGVNSVDKHLECAPASSEWKERDWCATANGQFFKRDQPGFMSIITAETFDGRAFMKAEMLRFKGLAEVEKDPVEKKRLKEEMQRWDLGQNANKRRLNSLYGAMASEYFMFYDPRLANAITKSGQLLIRWVARDVNAAMNEWCGTEGVDYWIASDTDSIYVKFGALVDKFFPSSKFSDATICGLIDNVCAGTMRSIIDKSIASLASYLNALQPERLSMKREVIANRGIWIAGKNYMLNTLDKEGIRYAKPKVEVKGLQAIKSSTPGTCREWMKSLFPIFLTGTEKELHEKTTGFREEYLTLDVDTIAAVTSISDVAKNSDEKGGVAKGATQHGRAAVTYNRAIEKAGLTRLYHKARDGDKIRYVLLKEPNPVGDRIIGWPGDFPKELKLEEYVDREKQYRKTFLKVLEPIAGAAGWDLEPRSYIDDY